MLFTVESTKGMDQVCQDLEKAVVKHKFGVMTVHNLRETMEKKGVKFDRECRIFEVCNPHQANLDYSPSPVTLGATPPSPRYASTCSHRNFNPSSSPKAGCFLT